MSIVSEEYYASQVKKQHIALEALSTKFMLDQEEH